ncbi:MAG: DUF3604 domain-containing protein, partial [Verrucomicrobia bacterium]|nr:DUF3604 domain-containing protein [Verrucomicrobiota bacterium]
DWDTPQTNLKQPENVIYALLDNGKTIAARAVEQPLSFVPQFEFTLPQEVPAGANITICMGTVKGKDNDSFGNKAQLTLQRRRPFLLYIDPSGKGNYHDPETFTLDIRGNTLHTIRILAPSVVIKNKRFDVVLRFEDEFGNLTNNAPDSTLIELTHENLRENLKWKLFVPETGFISLPNLYFNEVGVYTIELRNVATKEVFHSYPIKCFAQDVKHLFWGLLHGESERFDSTESIESCLRHFRDEKAMNFTATSPFESQEETPNDTWKLITQNVDDFNEDERFITFTGMQWVGEAGKEGVRQMLFAKGDKTMLRKKEARFSSLQKIYRLFSPKEILSIPSFTMGKGFGYDFNEWNPDFERVVEIYNAWGSSECTAKEGNPRPIKGPAKTGISENAEGSILKALLANKRVGFVAGGLDDRDIYSNFYDIDQEQYSPGLTGILSDVLTRQSLFESLYNRHCYATTGERIVLGLELAGKPMGSEIDSAQKPGLHVNRHITGYVAGTCTLTKVELIRNGKTIMSYTPKTHFIDFAYDDMSPLSDAVIRPADKSAPFVFYYLRVTQEDGHMAWSSPIWVDYKGTDIKLSSKKPETKSTKKSTK